jgi:hypothetical protein
VVTELLAVVGGHDHCGPRARREERVLQPPERRVRRGDLGIVAVDVTLAERVVRVRLVGLVGAEQVHPGEERPSGGRVLQVALELSQPLLALCELDPPVLEVERPLAERLETRPVDEEHGWRVKGCRAVAVRAEEPGPGVRVESHPLQEERAHVLAGHERGDGVRGVRSGRVSFAEARALGGQAVEDARRWSPVAVGTHVIGAQRVDRDEQEVPSAKVEAQSARGARASGRCRERRLEGCLVPGGGRSDARSERHGLRRHRRRFDQDEPKVIEVREATSAARHGEGDDGSKPERQHPSTRAAGGGGLRPEGEQSGRRQSERAERQGQVEGRVQAHQHEAIRKLERDERDEHG